MKVLITGIAGYIGSITAYSFLKQGYEVVGIDDISTGDKRAIDVLKKDFSFDFYEGSLADTSLLDEIFTAHKIDTVVHFAANTSVFESTQNPLKYYDNNIVNMISLLSICKKHSVKNFIFSSSAAVYGEPKDASKQIIEETQKAPINPYGMTKLMGEYILEDVKRSDDEFNYVALRYFNVAGASLIAPLGQFKPSTLLIKIAAMTATGKKDKMMMYGDDYDTHDGTCIRDYIHVDDLAEAHIEAMKFLQDKKQSEAFNVGYSKGASVKEVIDIMKEVSGVDFKVELAPRRTGDPSSLVASNKKILKLTKWKYKNNDLKLICKSAYEWEKSL